MQTVIRTSSAKMPSAVRAKYLYCAVMQNDNDAAAAPSAIRETKGWRIIWKSSPYPASGKTPRSARKIAEAIAEEKLAAANMK